MGIYVNSKTAYALFASEVSKPYFIDKSLMIQELFPFVRDGNNHICITRPRRFGKTIMANMIAAFFSSSCGGGTVFQDLLIARTEEYGNYLNRFPVIHISLNELPKGRGSYEKYIVMRKLQ